MSVYELRSLPCGSCGEVRTVKVADSANPLRHPPFLDQLLDRTLNRFTCEDCGHLDLVDDPMLWTDVTHFLVAAMLPEAMRPDWAALEGPVGEGLSGPVRTEGPGFVQGWGTNAQIRVVFGLEELREKVVASRAGIDDRAVELCKLPLVDRDLAEGPALDRVDLTGLHLVDARHVDVDAGVVPWADYDAAVGALRRSADVYPGLSTGGWVHWLRAGVAPRPLEQQPSAG